MAQQKGFKRAQKVAVRARKKAEQAKKAGIRRLERQTQLASQTVEK